MKENTLLKIALICSLIGLVVLYFISAKIEVKDYNLNKLNEHIGDDVKFRGAVTKITKKGEAVFIEISQQIPVDVVLFANDDNSNLNKLNAGNYVEVIGKVQEYNGKNEIIADNIMVIK